MKSIHRFLIVAVLSVLIALPHTVRAERDAFRDEWITWLNYYYAERDDSKLPEFLSELESSNHLYGEHPVPGLVTGFLAQLVFEKPGREALLKTAEYDRLLNGVYQTALFKAEMARLLLESSPDAEDLKRRAAEEGLDFFVLIGTPHGGGDIDAMWGTFFASGNGSIVWHIASWLDGSHALEPGVPEILRWSLAEGGFYHARAEKVIAAMREDATGPLKEHLEAVWNEIEKKKEDYRLDVRDGDFAARFSIIPPDVPFDSGTVASPSLERVKAGEAVELRLVIAGFAVNDHLIPDVTYSVEATGPDGSTYLEKSDAVARKGISPARFLFFRPDEVITHTFAEGDPPGVYEFSISVTDHLTGKKLRLARTIEFMP